MIMMKNIRLYTFAVLIAVATPKKNCLHFISSFNNISPCMPVGSPPLTLANFFYKILAWRLAMFKFVHIIGCVEVYKKIHNFLSIRPLPVSSPQKLYYSHNYTIFDPGQFFHKLKPFASSNGWDCSFRPLAGVWLSAIACQHRASMCG